VTKQPARKIRVLIVDDSAIVRRLLSDYLGPEEDIEVVGTAPDPYVARDKIVALQPDVLTLDIEMPRMDGLTFLEKLMRFHPLPVIMISSLAQPSCNAALEAVRRGAVEVMAKPGGPYSVADLRGELARRIRAAAAARLKPHTAEEEPETPLPAPAARRAATGGEVIAIGASTGGTQAIETVIKRLPADMPPIVIVQHIPPVFSASFAHRLSTVCALRVKEAADGDALERGLALVAPGDAHMVVTRSGGVLRTALHHGEKVCYQRPSVDVLFRSVAETAGQHAVAALLTGMGSDGAAGLLALREAGAYTIAQDEASSVVFGMPREAIQRGAAVEVVPLHRIAHKLIEGGPAHRPPSPAASSDVSCAALVAKG
jgi:two-component system chemotaxis response regulator CheB